jgi:hypothetical protein
MITLKSIWPTWSEWGGLGEGEPLRGQWAYWGPVGGGAEGGQGVHRRGAEEVLGRVKDEEEEEEEEEDVWR